MVDGSASRCEPGTEACAFEVTYDVTPSVRTVLPTIFSGNQVIYGVRVLDSDKEA